MNTQVWFNKSNGHHFSIGPRGMELNGKTTVLPPDWAKGRDHDAEYGPLQLWLGGECPIDPNTQICAIFRNRYPYFGPAIWPEFSASAAATMWHHAPSGRRTDPNADIVGYMERVM